MHTAYWIQALHSRAGVSKCAHTLLVQQVHTGIGKILFTLYNYAHQTPIIPKEIALIVNLKKK